MAKVKSLFKIEGTLGEVTFYTKNGQNVVRQKSTISKDRILNDPSFVRTRENNAEFKNAVTASTVFREVNRPILSSSMKNLHAKLVKKFYEILKTDLQSARGERQVHHGNLLSLIDYDVYAASPLKQHFYGTLTTQIDRINSKVDVGFQVNPIQDFKQMSAATHYSIQFAVFEGELKDTVESKCYVGQLHRHDFSQIQSVQEQISISPGSLKPIFCMVSLNYYQMVNQQFYPLKNGTHDSFKIIAVDI